MTPYHNSGVDGSRTPAAGSYGRTPAYAGQGGATPAYSAESNQSGPYAALYNTPAGGGSGGYGKATGASGEADTGYED